MCNYIQKNYNLYDPEHIQFPQVEPKFEFNVFTTDQFLNCNELKKHEGKKLSIDAFLYFCTSQIQFQKKNKKNFQKNGKFAGKTFDELNKRFKCQLEKYQEDHKEELILTTSQVMYFRNCYSFLLGKYNNKNMNEALEYYDDLIDEFIFNCDDDTIDSLADKLALNENDKELIKSDIFLTFTLVIAWVDEAWKEVKPSTRELTSQEKEIREKNIWRKKCKTKIERKAQKGRRNQQK